MRLMQANIRTVWVRERDETADESLYAYQPDGIEIYADIQPTGYSDSRSQEKARLWGEVPCALT
ncbi:hypothetical protein FACS1894184_18310 [Clostridia bacterium]|nr:hypothetical protein FACS1894184_18310 [Clostridia bacterium]